MSNGADCYLILGWFGLTFPTQLILVNPLHCPGELLMGIFEAGVSQLHLGLDN